MGGSSIFPPVDGRVTSAPSCSYKFSTFPLPFRAGASGKSRDPLGIIPLVDVVEV